MDIVDCPSKVKQWLVQGAERKTTNQSGATYHSSTHAVDSGLRIQSQTELQNQIRLKEISSCQNPNNLSYRNKKANTKIHMDC